MFDPPPGFDDLIGDAETAPHADRYTTLEVPRVGVVAARRPMPGALAALAMSVNADTPDARRSWYAAEFVQDHLGVGEWERLSVAMLDGEAPDDTVTAVGESIATWGTARPYTAVAVLALQSAYMWRAVRLKLLTAGIADPMGLPSMHVVLDVTEKLIVESMDEEQLTGFFDRLYGPPRAPVTVGKGRKRKKVPPPPGFSPEEMAASWRAWTSAQGSAAR